MLAAVLARGDAGMLHVGGPHGIWDHAAGKREQLLCFKCSRWGFCSGGWTETMSMTVLLGMLVAMHMHKVAVMPDGQKQTAFAA